MVIPSSRKAQRAAAEPHGTHPAIIWGAVLGVLFLLCSGTFCVALVVVILIG